MKEFVMIFRSESLPEKKFSPDEMQEVMKAWQNWMGGMATQGKLASSGNRLGGEGRSVKPGNVITNGPFVELKEIVSGYIVVHANSIEKAGEMAKGCPLIVGNNGFVEVRDVIQMNG